MASSVKIELMDRITTVQRTLLTRAEEMNLIARNPTGVAASLLVATKALEAGDSGWRAYNTGLSLLRAFDEI